MELMYPIVILIGIIAVAIMSFIHFPKKDEFDKSKKVVSPEYLLEEDYYRRKVRAYKILLFLTKAGCVLSLIACLFLVARPYTTEMVAKEEYNRDIMICVDISYSVDGLNQKLMKELKNTVKSLDGERFGILIFNCTPALIVPLTDDYEYVLEVLDELESDLKTRDGYSNLFSYMDYEGSAYLSGGTEGDNGDRGSSLIPDGLASAVYSFTDLDDPDRTRIIILTTDNDLQGEPLITLDEAADICVRNNVTCFGIGTEKMYSADKEEMKNAMLKTGGAFYVEEDSGSMSQIIASIQKLGTNRNEGDYDIRQVDEIKMPFIVLMISLTLMLVFTKIAKL